MALMILGSMKFV